LAKKLVLNNGDLKIKVKVDLNVASVFLSFA